MEIDKINRLGRNLWEICKGKSIVGRVHFDGEKLKSIRAYEKVNLPLDMIYKQIYRQRPRKELQKPEGKFVAAHNINYGHDNPLRPPIGKRGLPARIRILREERWILKKK